MRFRDKYKAAAAKNRSWLCIGLDSTDYDLIKKITTQTHDLVSAYKPNSAFYEAEGSAGIEILKNVCLHLQEKYPEIPIILDAKRGDIGSTNEQYAKYVFEYLKVDAVTLHPYQGLGALAPFERYEEKGLIALVKTSNPESAELQDLKLENGKKVWEQVAEQVIKRDGGRGQWGMVVGATYPRELAEVRRKAKGMVILVPGVGAQGGRLEDILGRETSQGGDLIINVGRSIWQAEDPRAAAKEVQLTTEKYASV